VPTQGDLYEANIFVDESRVSALLDLDGVGPGYRVDDLSCLLAHLAVLPSLDRRYGDVPRQLRWLTPALMADVARHGGDPRGLWVRAASVVLTLVAGIPGEDHPASAWRINCWIARAEGPGARRACAAGT
jgi:hypothetical protein